MAAGINNLPPDVKLSIMNPHTCDIDAEIADQIADRFVQMRSMAKRVRVAPPWVRGGKKHGSPEDRGSATGTQCPYNPHWYWYSDYGCQTVESEHDRRGDW